MKTITSLYISIAALLVSFSRWLWDIIVYFYRRTEKIEFQKDRLYEVKIDPQKPNHIYDVPLLFKNTGRRTGSIELKEVKCPEFESYFIFSVYFKTDGSTGYYLGSWNDWRADIADIDAQYPHWARLFITRKVVAEYVRAPSSDKVKKHAELPTLPATVPVTLCYKRTTKSSFETECEEIFLRFKLKQSQ